MIGHGWPGCRWGSLSALVLLSSVAFTGCAGPRSAKPPATMQMAKRVMEPIPASVSRAKADDPPPATVSAVEEFLSRTQDYQIEGTVAQKPKPPASPARNAGKLALTADGPVAKPKTEKSIARSRPAPADENAVVTSTQGAMDVGGKAMPTAAAAPVLQSVSIRSRAPSGTAAAKPVSREKATNTPLAVGGEDGALSIDRFLGLLKKHADKNGDLDSAWQYRLVQKVLGRGDGGENRDSAFSPDTLTMFSALSNAMDAVRSLAQDPLSTGEDAVVRVSTLRELVAKQADPVVETVALCRRVVTYGVIEEMAASEFVAGRSLPTIVYAEISNLRSEPSSDNMHRTVFATRIEVFTSAGRSVWHHEEPEIVDRCRRQRHDFFVAQRITLPSTLGAGNHVLKFLIEDKLSGKVCESAFDFTISAADTLTASR